LEDSSSQTRSGSAPPAYTFASSGVVWHQVWLNRTGGTYGSDSQKKETAMYIGVGTLILIIILILILT